MEKTDYIVTSGHTFVDIDAFACIYAYQELLRLKGLGSTAFISATLNASITEKYRRLNFYVKDSDAVSVTKEKKFVIMDVSDPDNFEQIVDLDSVIGVFDHHPGFESFWAKRLGNDAVIEPIGAAATLVFREYEKSGLSDKISPLAAELLAVAIISNTLLFQLKLSTQEDLTAYEKLQRYFDWTERFESDYFSEVQNSIERDMTSSLRDDAKSVNIQGLSLFIAQLEVWDAGNILKHSSEAIERFLFSTKEAVSFLNLVEIGKKRSLLVFRDVQSLERVKEYFPEFEYFHEKKMAVTSYATLRKELLTKLYSW